MLRATASRRDVTRERAGLPMSADTPFRRLAHVLAALVACLAAMPALAQRGAMTVPRNLDQLTDRAQDIVRGTVVDARVEKHPELDALDTIVVTLRVRDTLKGAAQGTFTFRQYIWDVRDRYDAAGYRKGQDVLLFMIAPSRHGLSSPAGMQQGRFHIRRDAAGREVAVNGSGNVRLFEGLRDPAKLGVALSARQAGLAAKHRRGPVAVDELSAMVRAFARND
jgi:hypothetical protein